MTDSKRTILARRAKFVAAAVASVSMAACSSSSSETGTVKDGGADADAIAVPCLGVPADSSTDTAPVPCLDQAPPDAGDAAVDARDAAEAATDTLVDDTGPAPCLKMPLDAGTD